MARRVAPVMISPRPASGDDVSKKTIIELQPGETIETTRLRGIPAGTRITQRCCGETVAVAHDDEGRITGTCAKCGASFELQVVRGRK